MAYNSKTIKLTHVFVFLFEFFYLRSIMNNINIARVFQEISKSVAVKYLKFRNKVQINKIKMLRAYCDVLFDNNGTFVPLQA